MRVRAAGVNPGDWRMREGFYGIDGPAVLGREVAGTVLAGVAHPSPHRGARTAQQTAGATALGLGLSIDGRRLDRREAVARPRPPRRPQPLTKQR